MTRIVRDAAHRVEHRYHELRARLVALQVDRGHRDPLEGSAGIPWAKMVERERQHILFAALAAAKRCITRAKLVVDVLHRPFQQVLEVPHTASGNAARSRTTAPVKVEPVVPVSSTVR